MWEEMIVNGLNFRLGWLREWSKEMDEELGCDSRN